MSKRTVDDVLKDHAALTAYRAAHPSVPIETDKELLAAEIEALRAAVLWLTGCLKGTGYQVVTDMDAIGTTDGPAVWNAHHAAVIARALEAPDA